MRSGKKLDIFWDANAALIDFAAMPDADHIAVAMQMTNLIYARNKPIVFDANDIRRYVTGMSRAKCEKVIHSLIHMGAFFLDETGKISSKKCQEMIDNRREVQKKLSVSGKIGNEIRWGNQENQSQSDRVAKENLSPLIPNTHTQESKTRLVVSKPASLHSGSGFKNSGIGRGGFRMPELSERDLNAAKRVAPGWDIYALIREFEAWVDEKGIQPDNHVGLFMKFCKGKGKCR